MSGAALGRIVSGGQTGVDRAALDAALEAGVPCGGWCPRGRRAEDGAIPVRYPLRETPSASYPQRTEWNVRDSDGTLVMTRGRPRGGSALTVRMAAGMGRPVMVVDLDGPRSTVEILAWVDRNLIRTLNVAGPRESDAPGIGAAALALLREVLAASGLTAPAPG